MLSNDIVLINVTSKEGTTVLAQQNRESLTANLSMNWKKMKMMCNPYAQNNLVTLERQQIEYMEECYYLAICLSRKSPERGEPNEYN